MRILVLGGTRYFGIPMIKEKRHLTMGSRNTALIQKLLKRWDFSFRR